MSIKPVLVPDHDAASLRGLMDRFAEAATGPVNQQLTEMDYGGGRSPHAGMGLPRDDDDDAGKKEIMVKPETAKKTVKSIGDRLDQAFAQAYDDKGVTENDMSALAGYAAGIVGGAAVPFAVGSLAVAFRDALHRTDDLAKRRARVDTAEIVALQQQIVSIHKILSRVKTDATKEKYQAMLKKAYKVLDELKARQDNRVAEGLVKDIKRLATGKDVKSRAGQEIAKSQDASMKGDNKTSKKHFDRYDKLDKLTNKEQGMAEVSGIGSKLPKSDIETFGLQKGRPYKINPPKDFKPGDRKPAVQQLIPTQDKKDHIRSRLGKHVAPVLPESDMEEGAENNPVINAITRRIMLQRTDLLSKYGPELVGQAIDEVADFVGDVEEIGSSDVSGWIRHVEQMLGNMESDIAEASPPGGFKPGDRVTVQGQKGPTGSTTGVFVQQIPTTTGQKPMYAFRFDDKKYTGNTYDMVSANNIFPATVAESIDPVEQLRADIRRFAR